MRTLRTPLRLVAILLACTVLVAQSLTVPNRPESVKFAVLGDMGTGKRPQYEVGAEMATVHERFPFSFVIMLGDNLYGSQQPKDFASKFERPYKALLDAGVTFYASLGNHDDANNKFYKPWHMDGKNYYSFVKGNVRFFALDSTYMDRKQLQWLEDELRSAKEDWKIAFFHHPLYSSGGRHGSEIDLRVLLEPLFVEYGVDVVFSGHDHIYERIKPEKGIYYFVSGSGGQLRKGDLNRTSLTAAGYDQDQVFMIVEISGGTLSFQAITRGGKTVDSGFFARRHAPASTGQTSRAASPPGRAAESR